jgi:N-sulfoglucosamine sulfohydrolase
MLFRVALSLIPLILIVAVVRGDERGRPNVLIITVDDMSADSLGAFGCKLKDTSPSIDAFARGSLRLNQAYVQVGNCMPGRNIMWSGMFSHVNGVEGFVQNPDADFPVLCDLAKDAGYFAAIRGKVSHSTPYSPYAWDAVLDTDADGKKWHTKDAKSYGESTRRGIELAEDAGKPFCLMVNISDPHKPFYAQGKSGATIDDPHVPSRVFDADDVPVPGFLPDDAVIRKELAHYYSSVRRADDCFASVMTALVESGQADSTFVIFFSDHGMPLPFAKTQLYHHSTHTPMIVRWPKVTTPGSVDDKHMVSAVDLVPTLLDVMQHEHPTPERLHGRSFAPVIRGQSQADRDFVILQYNENSGRSRHPMRGIHTREHLYLYNPWSDGSRKFATATTGTLTYRQMVKRAATEPDVAARLELFDHRVVEELYDVSRDPDCLINLVDSPVAQKTLRSLRKDLAKSLIAINDPVAPLLSAVEDAALREAYMEAEDLRSKKARDARNKKARKPNASAKRPKLRDAITMEVPKSVSPEGTLNVMIRHQLAAELGPQKLHVTLKTAVAEDPSAGARIHREVLSISGKGEAKVEFSVPRSTTTKTLRVAAFVGDDYQSHLQHLNSPPIRLQD